MKSVTIITGQNLFDLAVQTCGDIKSVVELARLNNLSITSVLIPGDKLVIPSSSYVDVDIIRALPLGYKVASLPQNAALPFEFSFPNIFPNSL